MTNLKKLTILILLIASMLILGCGSKEKKNIVGIINPANPGVITGSIKGKVVLSGANDYSGVTISITQTSSISEFRTLKETSAITNNIGEYVLNADSGTYTITATKSGYNSESKNGIKVNAAQITNVDQITLVQNTSSFQGTDISSDINSNTTWTKDKSPYILAGKPIIVNYNVTLTINPGVTVKFNTNAELYVRGTLKSNGNINNIITYEAINYACLILFDPASLNNSISYCYFNGIHFVCNSSMSLSFCKISNNSRLFEFYASNTSGYLDYCTIINNGNATLFFGTNVYNTIIYVTNSIITNNVVGSSQSTFFIGYIERLTINNCNIHDNGIKEIISQSDYDINAQYNWWGTTDTSVIASKFTMAGLGTYTITGYKTSEITNIGCGW